MLNTAILAIALAATPAPAPSTMAPLFPKLDGFKLADGPTKYTPDNLYEYIDGGADAFLQQDFEELAAATYSNPQKVEITVDIYRHRDAVRAFAMYAQERPSSAATLPVGVEGYAGDDYFQFVIGQYYVKLTQAGPHGTSVLKGIAEKVAAGLPGTKEPPAALKCFPEKGKRVRGEKFSAHDFLGHAFLHEGFTAAYEIDGAHFRLFAIQGKDAADAHDMVVRYLAAAKASDAAKAEGAATVKDPLNGEAQLQWKGRWIWGAVDEPSKQRAGLVEELGKKLQALEK
jgi:hypothetical protein